MVVLQKYGLKNGGNKIQIKYWMELDKDSGDFERKMKEVPLNYSPEDEEEYISYVMRLPMIEVTRPQLEGLIIMAGLSF
jgi:hypothetical protein